MNNISTITLTNKNIKRDQLNNLVPKLWGHEEWIVNNAQYCGKKLVFMKNHGCSLHHHKIKHETFYVLSGQVILDLEYNGVRTIRQMGPGDTAAIPQLTWHRLIALTNAEVMEFSTYHMEEDSYRAINAQKFEQDDIDKLCELL